MAVHRLGDALPFVVGELGGRAAKGGERGTFRWRQWRYDGGGRLEILEPAGPPGGFLHRFLDRRGPGVHHVTFHVGDLDIACRRAGDAGFEVVGRDDSDPRRKEAFLAPRSALGIVVQLVETAEDGGERSAPEPHDPPAGPPGIGLAGLRLACRDPARARALWGEVLGGEVVESRGSLEARWQGSALRLSVDCRHDCEEGPVAIELVCLRPALLPQGPHPVLGAVFEPVDPDPAVQELDAGPSAVAADESDQEEETYFLDADDLEE